MKARLAAAAVLASVVGLLVATPASAAQLCVKADINVNGTAQNIEQCLPE